MCHIVEWWCTPHIELLQSSPDSTKVAVDGFMALGQPARRRAQVGLRGKRSEVRCGS